MQADKENSSWWCAVRPRKRRDLLACVGLGALAVLGIFLLILPGGEPPDASVVTTAPAGKAADGIGSPSTPSRATINVVEPAIRTASLDDPPIAATPTAPALSGAEVREIQTRLRGFGFNPGPIDGEPGRLTAIAATNYRQSRNQVQTDKVDRELLEQLRLDPAPQAIGPTQVVQHPPRSPARAATAARQPGPIDRLGRWLDSLVR